MEEKWAALFFSVADRYTEDLQTHRSKLALAEVSQISKDAIEKKGYSQEYEGLGKRAAVFI